MTPKKNIISSYDRTSDNIIKILLHLYQKVINNKWKIWFSFKRDFLIPFNQTNLGFIWSFIMPLVPISAYSMLAYIKVFKTSEDMPFLVYIVVGLTIWMFMANIISTIMNSIEKEKAILNKLHYPFIALIASNLGQVAFDTLLRFTLAIIVLKYYGYDLSLLLLYLPLFIIPLTLLCVGLGMIFMIINEIYKDTKNIINIFLRYGLFLSSVIFPLPSGGVIEKVNLFNPFNTYVVTIRELVVNSHVVNPTLFMITSLFSIFIFMLGCWLLYSMENRIRGYL